MESSKWLAAVASIWIQASCGASYAFGIYSPILKSSQGYDQSTLDFISVFKDIGANAGILSGLLYSAVARRPWVVHVAGAVQCFVGYFFMWLAVTGEISRPGVGLMCLFMFLAAHAQTFFNTANVVTSVRNFPNYGGTIVGIMKGFLGLSGAILIQVYQALFKGKPSTFLLMLAFLPTVLSLLLMLLVRVHEQDSREEKKYLNGFSTISMILATYLTFMIVIQNMLTLSQLGRVLMLLPLLILLSSPITVAFKAPKQHPLQQHPSLQAPLIDDPESIKPIKSSSSESPEDFVEIPSDAIRCHTTPKEVMACDAELSLLQAMRTTNFWLIFVAMLCGMGSGLATINNISQIGESLGYTAVERSTLVSLWSIWNFLGRFGAGFVSDMLMHRRRWARPLFMTLTLAAMATGHMIIGSGFVGNLYIGSVIVGICYGSQWSLMPTIASEIFGVKHMGTIFNTIAIASPVGSYILSVRVIGFIYDKEASKGSGSSCIGTHCFMLSFFILAVVSFFGFLAALALFLKTRGFYRRVVMRYMKHSSVR